MDPFCTVALAGMPRLCLVPHPASRFARRLLIAKYGQAATAAAVVGVGGTVVNMH